MSFLKNYLEVRERYTRIKPDKSLDEIPVRKETIEYKTKNLAINQKLMQETTR